MHRAGIASFCGFEWRMLAEAHTDKCFWAQCDLSRARPYSKSCGAMGSIVGASTILLLPGLSLRCHGCKRMPLASIGGISLSGCS